jgi:EAL domain-containing protein (putative c-di-GMP-specific phosphodiesterase class I)
MDLICLDDDPRIVIVLKRFLENLGHVVDFHVSVASFQSALASSRPNLALLDLNLGRESGIDVIQWLAQAHPEVPIVLISGYGDELLDTAQRIARSKGLRVLGTVAKTQIALELPSILEQGVAQETQTPLPGLKEAPTLTRKGLAGKIRRDQVAAYFQPIVSPVDGRLRGAEVLARLKMPGGKMLGASDFIPLAESSDLIYEVTETLFERLIESKETLAGSGLGFISVNLSPLILQQERTLVLMRRLVDGLGATCAVKAEITESTASAHPDIVRTVAAQIHLMGVSLAIDDFGIGHSSIRVLAELPFDTMKLDLSFISQMFDSPKALRLLHAMIRFGQTLDLKVIAEGVETEAQRRVLIDAGIDLAQGYLFGKPSTLDTLARHQAGVLADIDPIPLSKRGGIVQGWD